jgi:simple sugar transport system permease protein
MNTFLASLALAATPILLAALGGMLTQRAGVLNVALEGMMLSGAFAAIVIGSKAGSIWVGLLAAIGAALIVGAIFGIGCLMLRADVFVAGIGVNLFATGMASFLLVRLLDRKGSYAPKGFGGLPEIGLGPLASIPVVGPLLDGQSILVFATIPILIWAVIFVRRTRTGVHLSIAGEAPEALEALGVSPVRLRWVAIALCSVLCALAGTQLAAAVLDSYSTDMTAGRGYIALAAVFFGAARPLPTAFAAVLFGAAEALSNTLQIHGVSAELVLMLPYVLTIVALSASRATVLIRQRRRRMGRLDIVPAMERPAA